ncbi:fatty acyl-CoA reductase 1 [Octopus sinensis]|uniref:Fatty acyl-CoA reductase n=1 Tax=Octopus sinensis TaxID=2607531 RepID=A0A6P7SL24_9MOLL|nr:fatty acyl-CoA reductase 1 [Octopus sinensis]
METKPLPSVAEYYAGKCMFITGATGFIGKVLIEKLLRCCPGIKTIYMLMRPKKGQSIDERFQDLLHSRPFDKLWKERPDFHRVLHPIEGDIMEEKLGLKDRDSKLLSEEVEIVFHSAATIRFDEHIRLAVEMNVKAVRKMIILCRNFKKLEVFVHVSTAYANCDRPFIEENIYEPFVEPQKIIDALDWMDDDMLSAITPKLLGQKPNTYTFTKQLAEYLLYKEGSDLPLAIVRPSIVGAAWKEPLPGWIDNFNGPSGLYLAAGKGILRSVKCEFKAVADIVPVDIPVNLMITVGWYTALVKPPSILIYHCTTGSVNPFTWGEMESIVLNFFKKTPLEAAFRRPNVTMTNNSFLHDYWVFVSHMIPAYLTDLGYSLLGKKPRMVKIYNRLHRTLGILTYFTCQSWEWTFNNPDMLKNQLSSEDRKTGGPIFAIVILGKRIGSVVICNYLIVVLVNERGKVFATRIADLKHFSIKYSIKLMVSLKLSRE